jgi:peptidoglycan/LPS O-acetylase OafA/YrhL
VQLSRFCFRRTLRIFPPSYAFLGGLAVLTAVGTVQLPARDLLAAATYTANYFPERAWKVSHTWSLAVEEHVYLVWPALLAFLGQRRRLAVAVGFAVAAPLLRVAYGLFAPGLEIPVRSETIADAIAVGCLLAGAREFLHARAWYRRALGSRAVLALPLVIVAAHELQAWPLLELAVGYSVVNLGIALVIDRVVTHPHGRIGRVLNSRLLVTVGVMSYSIYLWQELVLDRYCTRSVCAFPLNLGVTVAAALGSYLVIERPSVALRKWLEPRLFRRARAARPDTAGREGTRGPAAVLSMTSVFSSAPARVSGDGSRGVAASGGA